MVDSYGAVTWWGFSPVLDLQLVTEDVISSLGNSSLQRVASCEDEMNILLVGAGDIRHVLWTTARAHRHKPKKLNIFVLESCLELYARDILLLAVALESPKRMGLQEKTELFLELYGNILVRQQTCEYIEKMALDFIKMVTDSDYLENKLPMLDLSQLKFKERDFLEGIFKFWKNPDRNVFDVSRCWDMRLRQHLGVRYDSRKNVFDWDYHMGLVKRGAEIIHTHEYKNWRNTGIAFQIREGTYNEPNKTMASGLLIEHGGEKHARRGYWGDILVSPYVAIGMECEEKSFFKKQNGKFTRGSEHIAEFNVLSTFHELAFQQLYVLPEVEKSGTAEINSGVKIEEITEEMEEAAEPQCSEETLHPEIESTDEEYEALPLNNVKVTFLPLNSLPDLGKKSKYQKRFDTVYFSNSMVHLLKPDMEQTFSDQATVILETAKFMLGLKDEQVDQYVEKVSGLARAAQCTRVNDVFEEDRTEKDWKEAFLFFKYNRHTQH
ncbi:hypothetical protein ScPMuIL_004983 [Solemya velum]